MKYNKINLNELQEAVTEDKDVEIAKDKEVSASELIIIKRDGREEPFDVTKLNKVVDWATSNNEYMSDELLSDTQIKLHNKIKITDMYNQLILTAVNKISLINPDWEYVAAKLYLLQMYKETWNTSIISDYPKLKDVIDKGIEYKIYDKETIAKLTDEEIKELGDYIDGTRDLLFNYKGLISFFDKYCLKYTKTKKLELPQYSYMRIAIALMIDEKNDKIGKIKQLYDMLSTHQYTVATPIAINALTPNQQLSSCVLSTVADDTHSLLDTNKNLGIYSKYKGGTAVDFSSIRASGSYIQGTQGYSSGPVPFIKIIEQVMKAWNQGGVRNGSNCVYYQWWHYDFENLIVLKSNGGTDENRARDLKYSVKINQLLIDRAMNDQDISLFDPKDVPLLNKKYGQEFNDVYEMYEKKSSIRRKTISARELFYMIMKERTETGNIYLYHDENVNEQTLLNRYIGSSNLCMEVVLPSRPSELLSEELISDEDGNRQINKKYKAGEIALCNLSSINLIEWLKLSDNERIELCNIIVRALDNTVDLAYYPVKEAKSSNKDYRYLGVGVMNYANYLALKGIVIDSNAAKEETDKLFDDISYKIITASMELAKEKGKFPKFYDTEWADGQLPIFKSNKNAHNLTNYQYDVKRWYKLSEDIKQFGLRNAQLLAIAPTACQTKDTKIQTSNGIKSFEDIMIEQKIDIQKLEKDEKSKWIDFDKSITVPTRFGDKKVKKIWYNGPHKTKTIVFEDDKEYTMTYNHKLLVKLNNKPTWIEAKDLRIFMNVVNVNSTKKIIDIIDNNDYKHTYDIEVKDVQEYILANGCISHNTSGKSINATESIEPIQNLFYKEDGTLSIPTVVPNFRKNNQYYKNSFDCDQKALVELAAIRQKWIDQAQSVNVYIKKPESLNELMDLHLYGFHLGMKTFYYLKQLKDGAEEVCESCS